MPKQQPILNTSQIRNYTERWEWTDPVTGHTVTGYNPPSNAVGPHHVPFTVTFLSEDGMPYKGRAVCIGVNTSQNSRRLQFIEEAYLQMPGFNDKQRREMFKFIPKGGIRQVSDILILEIDGVRFASS